MSHETPFVERLRTAVLADRAPLIFVGNFEVEEQWARGEVALPRLTSASGAAMVNRMDEFAVLLGGAEDHVIVKAAPDEDHLEHLRSLGLPLPTIHTPAEQDPMRTVTKDALADKRLQETLGRLGAAGAHLLAHGMSTDEEHLSLRAGIAAAAPAAEVCKAVNSKVYSRRAADELGIVQPRGWAASNLAELEQACTEAAALIEQGRTVVVKEAFGVSGKGIAVVDKVARLRRLQQIIATKVERSGADHAAFVIEEWVSNRGDLNYQFTVSRDGGVHFDFVKTALTEGGVHRGHRIPAQLGDRHLQIVRDTAEALGKKLAADGFFGVVGIDAIRTDDDGLYPVLEINARNNMSTYQVALQEKLLPGGHAALARHYPVRLRQPLPFSGLRTALGDLLLTGPGGEGVVIANFATVNAAAGTAEEFDGRLYTFLVAPTAERLSGLDRAISERVDEIAGGGR
ncbi:ATP-grasp domain-containing protein [Micromonospora sp. NPDC049044]|uniref:preATP grasp domain-containing protein n=1 Tax=unclassified Micromonospora TaxID=2617518 RepID=UPI0033E826CA